MMSGHESESVEQLSKRLNELQKKLKENPELSEDEQFDACKDAGLNLDHFRGLTPEQLKEKFEDLKLNFESLGAKLQDQTKLNDKNKAAERLKNYQKHLEGKDPTPEQSEKLNEFLLDYYRLEMEEFSESCFHYDQDSCNFIIDAHSLTENNSLRQIARNGFIYQIQQGNTEGSRNAELIHKGQASIFRGFCLKHDSVFHKVENVPFDGSLEHCFKHSYRSFAYSYHKLKELQEYPVDIYFKQVDIVDSLVNSLREGMSLLRMDQGILNVDVDQLKVPQDRLDLLKIERFEDYKIRLNTALESSDYSHLEYFVYKVGHKLPFACSSWIASHLKIKDTLVIEMNRPVYSGYPMMLTILPGDSSTIILARFKDDLMTKHLFNQLQEIRENDTTKLELVLSSMMLRFVDNLYFSPQFWDTVDSYIKDAFIEEMNQPREGFMELKPAPGMVNIFDNIYCLSE